MRKVSQSELPELTAIYLKVCAKIEACEWADPMLEMYEAHRNDLLDLVQEQTAYTEKRFWKIIDNTRKANN
jgi:hypothetical protein